MQRNMNSSPPRLPRLGGHKSISKQQTLPVSTSPSGPSSLNPSARIEPARASNSPERPYIDVGYDDDVPFARQQVQLLASLRSTSLAAPQQQAPSPHRPRQSPSSSSPSTSPSTSLSWKEQVKNEVLLGLSQGKQCVLINSITTSPSAAAAMPTGSRSDIPSSGEGEEDMSLEDATPHGSSDHMERAPQNLFPSMPDVLYTAPAFTVTASPVIPITGILKSPVSVASSPANDTPRSILRHPGRDRDSQPPRPGHRRISFIDLSPLRDNSTSSNGSPNEKPRRGKNTIDAEDDVDDDEYEFAEPLLRYERDTPPTSARNATAPEARGGGTNVATPQSPFRSPDRNGKDISAAQQQVRSPDVHPAVNRRGGRRVSPSPLSSSAASSPERPAAAGRSPTRSPPRNNDHALPHRAAPNPAKQSRGGTRSSIVASAPPPPEEESDVITLDRAPPFNMQHDHQQRHRHDAAPSASAAVSVVSTAVDRTSSPTLPHCSPNRSGRVIEKKSQSRSASDGRDEDILTQPHNHSSHPPDKLTSPVMASVGRRPLTRQRWPSDAYVDEPPTEVSTTQRAARSNGHRESLDPEDDMGSSRSTSSETGSDASHGDHSSDDAPSFHYELPVKDKTSPPRRNLRECNTETVTERASTPSPKAASPSRSPHCEDGARDCTKTRSQSEPRSPIERLPERRMSISASGSRASSVVSNSNSNSERHHKSRSSSLSHQVGISPRSSRSSSHHERPIPATPPSLTEGFDSGLLQHRHSSSREEHTTSSLLHESTTKPSFADETRVPARGEVATWLQLVTSGATAVASGETSHSSSRACAPSTITNHSSGQSVGEEAAPVAPTPQTQAAKNESPVRTRSKQEETTNSEHRNTQRHRDASEHVPPETNTRHSSTRNSPRRKERQPQPDTDPSTATVKPVKEVARKVKKDEREEPQVYVDPLLRERQHRHDVARQQSPTYLAKRELSNENVIQLRQKEDNDNNNNKQAPSLQLHKRLTEWRTADGKNTGVGGGAFEPVSLRDIMAHHDSPEAKMRKPASNSRAATVRLVSGGGHRRVAEEEATCEPTACQALHEPRSAHEKKSLHARTPSEKVDAETRAEDGETAETRSESSRLSSGGVAAEDLVWADPTPTSRASSASPPISPASIASSSSAVVALTTTSGVHKVFRKKLVKIVRRRRSGAPPSEDDPVVQLSMVPFREGSPEVQHAEARQEALRREREDGITADKKSVSSSRMSWRALEQANTNTGASCTSAMGAVSVPNPIGAPPLERLIDHIQPGRKSSVSSRRSTRNTCIRQERTGEKDSEDDKIDEVTEEERRQFRRALSLVSSRSVSRHSSVAPSAKLRRSPSQSKRPVTESALVPEEKKNSKRRSIGGKGEVYAACFNSDKVSSRRSSANSIENWSAVGEKTPRPSLDSMSDHKSKLKPDNTVTVKEKSPRDVVDSKASRKDESTMTPNHHHHRHHHHSTQRTASHRSSMQTEAEDEQHCRGSCAKSANAVSHRSSPAKRQRGCLKPLQQQPQQVVSAAPPPPPPQQQQQLPASLAAAPYRPTQNDEFYYGVGLEKEVAELRQRDALQLIGITPVAMPLLPRLALDADRNCHGPHGNTGAHGVSEWSAANSDADGLDSDAVRFAESGGSLRQRRLLKTSATQTDRNGIGTPAAAVAGGRGESGVPLTAATPVMRPAVSVAGSARISAPNRDVNTKDSPLLVAGAPALGDANGAAEGTDRIPAMSPAGTVAPIEGESESPESFAKLVKTPVWKVSARSAAASRQTNVGFSDAPVPVQVTSRTFPLSLIPPVFGPQQPPALFPSPYSAHVAAPPHKNPSPASNSLPQPATASSAGVPLFVPSLTVDNVSHLTQDWQAALRERSGKAKQSAMEQFLIASAEAGAASTLSGNYIQQQPQHYPAMSAAAGANSNSGYNAGAAEPANAVNNNNVMVGGGAAAYGLSEWEQRRWPAQAQAGLPANEYYGQHPQQQPQQTHPQSQQQPTAAAITAVPLMAQMSPPRALSPLLWDAEREVREKNAQVAAVSTASLSKRKQFALSKPSASTAKSTKAAGAAKLSAPAALKEKPRRRSSSSSLASPHVAAFELVEGSEVKEQEISRSSSSNTNDSSNSGRDTPEKIDAVEPLSQPRSRHTGSLSLPTAAALVSEFLPPHQHHRSTTGVLSAPADPVKPRELSKRHMEDKPSRRAAVAATAFAAAVKGRRSSVKPTPTGFTFAEPATEVTKSKPDKRRDDGSRRTRRLSLHPADHRSLDRSAGASTAGTSHQKERPVKDKETKEHDADNERRKRKDKKEVDEKANKCKPSKDRHHHDKSRRRTHSTTSISSSVASSSLASDASSWSRFSIPDLFHFSHYKPALEDSDGDSDVDSDLATSIEFQLSRLLLQREKDVSLALTSLQREQEKTEAWWKRKVEREREKEKEKKEKTKQKKVERGKSRHNRCGSISSHSGVSSDHKEKRKNRTMEETGRKRKGKDTGRDKKQREDSNQHGSTSAASKKSKKDGKHKSKSHRSKSSSKPEPLPLPPPPQQHPRDGRSEDVYTPRERAEPAFVDSRYSSPPYESTGAARYDGALPSAWPYTRHDYTASASYRAATAEDGDGAYDAGVRSSSAQSYFRSRSGGLDNSNSFSNRGHKAGATTSQHGAASPYSDYLRNHRDNDEVGSGVGARYARRRPYSPSAAAGSRWADTPHPFTGDDDETSPASATLYASRYRSGSRVERPSTYWADYVRAAARKDRLSPTEGDAPYRSSYRASADRRYSSPSSSARYMSFGQRRQSTGDGTASPRTNMNAYAPRTSPSSTGPPYTPSYANRTDEYSDIDDVPKKNYFNSDDGNDTYGDSDRASAGKSANPASSWSSYAARTGDRGATSSYSYTEHRQSSVGAEGMPPPPPPSSSYSRHRRSTTAPSRRKEDDILVSTPSQDGDDDRGGSYDYWEDRGTRQTQPRRGAAPPPPPPAPPTPPGEPLSSSTRAPSSSGPAFVRENGGAPTSGFVPNAKALSIASEHNVTDAQSAHDFAEGVKEIVSALRQYQERQ